MVILCEQVRTASCPRLRGFLQLLRNGQQSELDFERLCRRLDNPSSKATSANRLRAITLLNQDRWDLNMAAGVKWARAHGKHISTFVAKLHNEAGRQLQAEDLYDVLRYGDNSQLPTPGLLFSTRDAGSRNAKPVHWLKGCQRGPPSWPLISFPIPQLARLPSPAMQRFTRGLQRVF